MALSRESRSRLDRIDWDFTGDPSESPFSPLLWQPGRFASQIPAALIGILSRRGQTVLDPFAGSGTTLVEAQRLGRRGVGVELNPVACLGAQAKTLRVSAGYVEKLATGIRREVVAGVSEGPKGASPSPPSSVQGSKWYEPRVLRDLVSAWEVIKCLEGKEGLLGRFAFTSILLRACRETRHWGYVCDNTTPKSHRTVDVVAELTSKLEVLAGAYAQRDEVCTQQGLRRVAPVTVYCADASEGLSRIRNQSVDLVVTSPPYQGVCDYIKSQRLALEWLGIEIEPLRLSEIGARSKRSRRTASEEYSRDLEDVWGRLARKVKRSGLLVLVIGESRSRSEVLPDLKEGLSRSGWKLEHEVGRAVSMARRQAPSIRTERIWVLGKDG